MDGMQNMKDVDLLKACMPLVVHPSFPFLIELLCRKKAQHMKLLCTCADTTEIYRMQGRVKAYDELLNIGTEIKALR